MLMMLGLEVQEACGQNPCAGYWRTQTRLMLMMLAHDACSIEPVGRILEGPHTADAHDALDLGVQEACGQNPSAGYWRTQTRLMLVMLALAVQEACGQNQSAGYWRTQTRLMLVMLALAVQEACGQNPSQDIRWPNPG